MQSGASSRALYAHTPVFCNAKGRIVKAAAMTVLQIADIAKNTDRWLDEYDIGLAITRHL